MWSSVLLKPTVTGLLWACLLLLLAWRIPAIAQAFAINQAAVNATSFCGGTSDDAAAQQVRTAQAGYLSWFELAEARCAGEDAETSVALRDVLTWSGTRMSVLRVIAPTNVSLADLAVRTYPSNADAYFWLAEILASKQDVPATIQNYEKGLALEGTDANAWEAVGHLYEVTGDLDAAVGAYDQACHYVDRGKNGCGAAARLHMGLGQYDKALESYKRVVGQIPYYPVATKLRPVDGFLKVGRTAEAAEYLRYLIEHGISEARPLLEQLEAK
jgi:tetratricopeptide (TPR) repeat protein